MKLSLACGGLVLSSMVLLSQRDASVTLAQERTETMTVESQRALVDKYCAGCHNDSAKSGGFSWSGLDLAHPEQSAQQAERVLRKLKAGLMPPAGLPRPDKPALDQ